MKPTRPYRAVAVATGVAVILAFVGLWAHGHVTGEPLGTLWDVAFLALVFAAGYAVFGRRTMSAAIDQARETVDGDGGDDEAQQ